MKQIKSFTVSVELALPEAYALAELCKRIGWRDAESLAIDKDEARSMLDACDQVRVALSHVGVIVR